MALIRPDQGLIFVKGIPLFLVSPDNFLQHIHRNIPGLIDPGQKFFHISPSMFIQLDPDDLRIVPENQADKFAQTGQIHIFIILHFL